MNVHEKLKKNEAKPLEIEAKYLAFDYQGKKLVRLQGEDRTPAISFNCPKLHMSESFDITFRRKNDKWIISR